MGHRLSFWRRGAAASDQVFVERTTGFEPATLTLAIRRRMFMGCGQIALVLVSGLANVHRER